MMFSYLRVQLPAPERLGGFAECLFAGETHVAEQPSFLSEFAQRPPLADAGDPGRDGVEARAQR